VPKNTPKPNKPQFLDQNPDDFGFFLCAKMMEKKGDEEDRGEASG